MELLNPSYLPHIGHPVDPLYGFSPSLTFPLGFYPMVSPRLRLSDAIEDGGVGVDYCGFGYDAVFVAVGKSVDKTLSLLQWTFSRFSDKEICLLHIHQPSSAIPTLLGKLPANQASREVVDAYRKDEWQQTRKLIDNYLDICSRAKVKARIVMAEADQVQKGIVDLVNKYGIRKLVMGTVPDHCMNVKVKKSSKKANYAAKYIPLLCEIWFINKGKHVWTREAADGPSHSSSWRLPEISTAEMLRSQSFEHGENDLSPTPSGLFANKDFSHHLHGYSRTSTSTSTGSGLLDSNSKALEEDLYSQLKKASTEAEVLRKEAITEILKRKKIELLAVDAMNKVKMFGSNHVREVKLRKEVEDALNTAIQEQEKLLKVREEVQKELQRTMRNVALLDSRSQEVKRRQDEASEELVLIQASIESLQQEKQKIEKQKTEALRWLERWRSIQGGSTNWKGFVGFVEDATQLTEFSLSELQIATCDFSESFKIGQGGYGCVYKGELLGRTVAIRKLHPHNMQGPSEFQQEVQVLGNLQHPHLVALLGVCTEAWSLVYEYLPNGNLQNHLIRKGNTPPLTWKNRVRLISEISSALCFLHTSKPEKVVHGDLKPENILLDSKLSCKICDFGICRLVCEETLNCPSFRQSTEPKGAFSYTDPEFQRDGVLTPNSDVYSFGLIVLQLLTGKPTVGLAGEVRRAVSCGQIGPVLDLSGGEWPVDVAKRLVEIGLQCCELKGRDRPELTPALVRELKQLNFSEERPVPSYFLCPILQEIMNDPQVAADGFTYEGEAIRGWLENGRETSPMTNLELTHLHLTPNHALRLAIQDWLSKP